VQPEAVLDLKQDDMQYRQATSQSGDPQFSVVGVPGDSDLDIGVIYTYEDHFMSQLLTSLAQSGPDLKLRLVLVDNASANGVSAWNGIFPVTTVIRNDQRLSYAENLNLILEHTEAPYVLLLNTDMYFDPHERCLSRMVSFMKQHPDCGVSGCRLYRADESYAHPPRRFQTLRTLAARRLGATWLEDEVQRYLYLDRDHRQAFDCDWLSGCFLMVRRSAFEEIGYLDTQFRKYFEDVDYCLRMASSGWRVMFNGQTYCYHLEQRASRRWLSKDAMLHAMSYWKWLRKWGFHPGRHVADLPDETRRPRRAA